MNPDPILTPTALLAATAALIAFHIGLLTLVGRERKSPYVINSVLPIFLVSLVVAAIGVVAAIVPQPWRDRLVRADATLLTLVILWSVYHVYRIAVRFAYFVDSVSPKHFHFNFRVGGAGIEQ